MSQIDTAARDEYPLTRKVGRYGFYLICACSVAMIGTALIARTGVSDDFARSLVTPISIIIFIALRDIEKNAFKRARAFLERDGDYTPKGLSS